ncbi:hypothetical protein PybrP1_003039 [[Pythium] brassicae (nom. inval.)]|nr:hypothetical protein PybrP1_003039 [[Pythium] brassicae (nom. inval.)]
MDPMSFMTMHALPTKSRCAEVESMPLASFVFGASAARGQQIGDVQGRDGGLRGESTRFSRTHTTAFALAKSCSLHRVILVEYDRGCHQRHRAVDRVLYLRGIFSGWAAIKAPERSRIHTLLRFGALHPRARIGAGSLVELRFS